jgi:hypothetical protein
MNAVALHSPRHHRVAFKIGPSGIELEFQCHAAAGSSCYRGHDECDFVAWMQEGDSTDAIESFTGEKTWARSGGITPTYTDDYWTWSYTT